MRVARASVFRYKDVVKIWIAMGLLIGACVAGAQNAPVPQRPLTLADLERMYLDGRISAKEFQQHLKQVQQQPQAPRPDGTQPPPATQPAPSSSDPQARALEMLRKLTGKTNEPAPSVRAPGPNPKPAGPPPTTVAQPQPVTPPPEAANPAITDVETKMNELLRLKEAREKATATNAPPVSNSPKSKRQRLDDLLKQFIDGKMTEPEYKQRREKIIAEPE